MRVNLLRGLERVIKPLGYLVLGCPEMYLMLIAVMVIFNLHTKLLTLFLNHSFSSTAIITVICVALAIISFMIVAKLEDKVYRIQISKQLEEIHNV